MMSGIRPEMNGDGINLPCGPLNEILQPPYDAGGRKDCANGYDVRIAPYRDGPAQCRNDRAGRHERDNEIHKQHERIGDPAAEPFDPMEQAVEP